MLGGELTSAHEFTRVAEAMGELGLDDEVLAWATRGIAQTSGRQTDKLYDVACDVHTRRREPLAVLALRRGQQERMPSSSTYRALRTAADALDAWPLERDAARALLQRTNPRDFVLALLSDGELDLAWDSAASAPQEALGSDLWLRLAEACESVRPADALMVYLRVAGEVLEQADRRSYRHAARILQRAGAAGGIRRIWRLRHAAARAVPATAVADRDLGQSKPQVRRRPQQIVKASERHVVLPPRRPNSGVATAPAAIRRPHAPARRSA